MSKPIIEVKGISKRYQLGSISAQTMRAEVEAFFARFKKTKSPATSHSLPATAPTGASATSSNQPLATSHSLPNTVRSAEFWALRDVSFDVQPGEVVGIIGRNGAGKSTLLKILSRITEPTSGEIRVRGRIASLLEVGTGFHPELSGRENIFLNGAILGMSKAEIRAKFDEIVDFAGVEQFIDTPVKRYSSGMYVRLAFAVAAHLEPEILIVDEVLAVGDAEFQKKCLGKIKDVAGEGRTVLFVSHNMQAIQSLCPNAIVLQQGQVKFSGPADMALSQYLDTSQKSNFIEFKYNKSQPSITFIKICKNELEKGNLLVEIGFKSPIPLNPPVGGVAISSPMGTPVFGTNPRFHREGYGQPVLSEGVLRLVAENLPIYSGSYHLSAWLGDWQTDYDEKREILCFDFKNGFIHPNAPSPERIGFVDSPVQWIAY